MAEQQNSHSGQPIHWVEVITMVAGALVAGGALIAGSWPVFWIGVAIAVIAGIVAMATGIFGDVVLDEPRVVPELSHIRNGRSPTYRGVRPDDPPYLVPDDTRRGAYVTDTAGETERPDTGTAAPAGATGDHPA